MWYLQSNAYDVGNIFATKFISAVSRSVAMAFDKFSWSFNIVWHTSKAQVTFSSFSLFKNINPAEKSHLHRSNTNNFPKWKLILVGLICWINNEYNGKYAKRLYGVMMTLKYISKGFSILAHFPPRYIIFIIQKLLQLLYFSSWNTYRLVVLGMEIM